MLLWLLFAAMTGAAVLMLLGPLSLAREAKRNERDDVAFYRASLADIERDAARGLIGEAEAVAARTEAARRLLRSEAEARDGGASPDAARRRRILASLLVLIAAPAVALGVYMATGSPQLPDRPLAARLRADPAKVSLEEALARIEAHLARQPNDGAGHEVVAPVYLRMGRLDDAARAFAASLRLNGETPDRLASLAEALTALAGGVITAEAKQHFARAVALDAKHLKARYYLALAREQDGDRDGAIAALEELALEAAPDAPWLGAVRQRLAEWRSAPAGGEAIAGLPENERMAAIRAMVDGLSQRLAAQGGTLDDWSRLVRSHVTLGDRPKAIQALGDARRALGVDAGGALDALARELGLQGS